MQIEVSGWLSSPIVGGGLWHTILLEVEHVAKLFVCSLVSALLGHGPLSEFLRLHMNFPLSFVDQGLLS